MTGDVSAHGRGCGFTGVDDTFTGERNRNLFSAFAEHSDPDEMVRELGALHLTQAQHAGLLQHNISGNTH